MTASSAISMLTYNHNAPELNPNNGSTPVNNEVYEYGDYKYTYLSDKNGWKVEINTDVTDKNQTSYGPILESVNGKPIVSLSFTFGWCTSLTESPVIPSGVKEMVSTYSMCTALKTAPSLPNGLVSLNGTFFYSGILVAPEIPSTVRDMNCTFDGCSSMTVAPSSIPDGVTDLTMTFYMCKFTTAPAIPSSVTNLNSTFSSCNNLCGTIIINATNLTDVSSCLGGCASTSAKAITLTGSCPVEKLNQIKATGAYSGQYITVAP